jgi:hypothetical protein
VQVWKLQKHFFLWEVYLLHLRHNAVTISAPKFNVLSLQFSSVALMLTRVKWCCVQVRAVQCVGKPFQWASQMQSSILTLTSVWQCINKTHTCKGHLGLIWLAAKWILGNFGRIFSKKLPLCSECCVMFLKLKAHASVFLCEVA